MLYNYHLLCYVREMLDNSTATYTMSLVLSFVYLHVHALNAHQKSASWLTLAFKRWQDLNGDHIDHHPLQTLQFSSLPSPYILPISLYNAGSSLLQHMYIKVMYIYTYVCIHKLCSKSINQLGAEVQRLIIFMRLGSNATACARVRVLQLPHPPCCLAQFARSFEENPPWTRWTRPSALRPTRPSLHPTSQTRSLSLPRTNAL